MEIVVVKVRFAPSPTGYIHIGNTRIALFNWLYALVNQGTFVLRYDDTDIERSKQCYIDAIAQDLEWLNIKPGEVYYQSKRFERYNEVAEQLKKQGLLYPCFETAQELELSRKIKLTRGLPPIYDRKALKLTEQDKAELLEKGLKPHWRFLLPNYENDVFKPKRTIISWYDEVKGIQTIDLSSLSDPILIREDGSYLYTLPSVIDDIDMEITHIIRGDDHITNSASQIAIFETLGKKAPKLGHINLLTTSSGEGLSKRTGALSIRTLREDGFEPMAISCLASLVGTSENITIYKTMNELAEHFNLTNVSKSSAKFSMEDLLRLNTLLVHDMSYANIQEYLKNIGVCNEKAEYFWNVVKPNISKTCEVTYWWDIANNSELTFTPEKTDLLQTAINLLPNEPFNEETWKIWTNDIKDKTGKRGKELFAPLRFALTGTLHGPDLALFLPLMPKELIIKRLS